VIGDVLPFIDACRARQVPLGLATVVRTYGSAPRQVGAKMVVSASGEVAGSVSGGCVEGAVFEALQEVIASGEPRLLHFGVADEQAWEVGLACGGQIDVFVERLDW
jgi:xanthine/CO dehydrogenase XdhC/CoxF family maturation factor